MYLYRAVDEHGSTVESHLSRTRDVAAAKAFFRKALKHRSVSRFGVHSSSGRRSPSLRLLQQALVCHEKQLALDSSLHCCMSLRSTAEGKLPADRNR
jgi:transposase-like protein